MAMDDWPQSLRVIGNDGDCGPSACLIWKRHLLLSCSRLFQGDELDGVRSSCVSVLPRNPDSVVRLFLFVNIVSAFSFPVSLTYDQTLSPEPPLVCRTLGTKRGFLWGGQVYQHESQWMHCSLWAQAVWTTAQEWPSSVHPTYPLAPPPAPPRMLDQVTEIPVSVGNLSVPPWG